MTSAYIIERYIFRLLPLWVLMLLCGCTGDVLTDGVTEPAGSELPVEFEFVLAATRTDNQLIKDRESFKNKDVIHIEGRFTMPDQTDKEIRYGAMSYDAAKRRWTAVDGSELTWPDNATEGTFKAYYINPNGNDNGNANGGIIGKGSKSSTYSLSTLTYETDPLVAQNEQPVSYGHSVMLSFTHICTYLELRGLGGAVSDTYWFTRKNGALKNSFCLARNIDNTLKFTFEATPDSRYGTGAGLVYIATKPADGTAKFFLPPDKYASFTLCYPAVESNYYEYLEYTYIPSGNGSPEGPNLKANHSYLLDISKSKGITINTPPASGEDETWDDNGAYFDVDVEAFLRAVAAGADYYSEKDGERTQILQGGNNQAKLLHNVSFHYNKYNFFYTDDPEKFFEPIVKGQFVFDGGHHYIRDIACPVFHRNEGTIRNLGLRDINAEFISNETELGAEDKDAHDMSRNGILCGRNKQGTISNIRIAGAKITAKIKNDTETDEDYDASQEAHNIGIVVGSNTGTITDLALAGDFSLTVEGYTDDYYSKKVDAGVMIGGIVGQNAENGIITNVSSYEDTKVGTLKSIKITNNCSGDAGAFYVGGIAGSSSAYISWVTLPNVTIDGSKSSCVAMYMGGIAGQLSATGGGSAVATTSCNVTGSVKAGTVKTTNKADVTPKSYIGGVAGVLEQSITDCRTAVSVTVGEGPNEGVTYATGGAFGRILKTAADISIENILAYGDLLTGPSEHIGNFVGIAPKGKTWDGAYKGHDIVVKEHGSYEYVGFNKDEE